MNKRIAAVTAWALMTIAGCSSTPTPMAEVSTAITFPPLFSGQHDELSSYGPTSLTVGGAPIQHPGIIRLRVCNQDKSACRVGVAKFKAQLMLVSLNKTDATFLVDLEFDVGQEQTIRGDSSKYTAQMPDDQPTMRDNYKKSGERITLPYNRVGRIDMPYGVAFKICVEAPATEQNAKHRGCPGAEVELSRALQ
ncbi:MULTISPECIES: hypothetical protein [Pseudomonas syringae group]|uniref:hypothetical protein n=1 Tax=Pseudomonas syringae group TaxID=136849 RepID=UPI0011C48F99|nr:MULTISPECIES: hypothetical protein [Pseudomonas syringae group]MDH4602515.1 hypothetical protein [Pseudomonas syringae pv. papulans]